MRLCLKSGPTWGGQSKVFVAPQQAPQLLLLQPQLLLLFRSRVFKEGWKSHLTCEELGHFPCPPVLITFVASTV